MLFNGCIMVLHARHGVALDGRSVLDLSLDGELKISRKLFRNLLLRLMRMSILSQGRGGK